MSWTNDEAERVKSLEVNQVEMKERISEVNGKLDSLLELKNKGLGVFWLISILMGAAFTTIVTFVTSYFRG